MERCCVSDKPLHGELKLLGMASEFYKTQVSRHLKVSIQAMESLQNMPLERLHSRKLRSFDETAFLQFSQIWEKRMFFVTL